MKKIIVFFAILFMLVPLVGFKGLPHNIFNSGSTSAPYFVGSPVPGITVAGGNGAGSANNQLSVPYGVSVDANGNIYVADWFNHRVQKWAPGAITGVTVAGGNGMGDGANQVSFPSAVFVDAAGSIYVSGGYSEDRIQKWAPGASEGITVAGGNGSGSAANQLFVIDGFFVDAGGNIYITDRGNNRVQKWASGASTGVTVAGGNGQGSAANQLFDPADVFVDAAGNIYVADKENNRIQKWAPGASAGVTVAGGNGNGSADNQLSFPYGVFGDASGNLYIADQGNNRIQKWAVGALSAITVAAGNGLGSAANQLNRPTDVVLDARGNIYVSDWGNNRVQKFAPVMVASCFPDLLFNSPSCTGKAAIRWAEPVDSFPVSIDIPQKLDPSRGSLTYFSTLNKHGYYRSSNTYLWPEAKDIATYIGDTSVNGHLVTLTSDEENNLIYNQVRGTGYSPWIGLYNTGKPGQFHWVNGEALAYIRWVPGEPNNSGGNSRNVREPYVRLLDYNGAWNDQGSDRAPFIAEFETPLIENKQISGPANGSAQSPGTYQVCYEKINHITEQRDTCCFNITVTCNTATVNTASGSSLIDDASALNGASQNLHIAVSPNPSSNGFSLNITSKNYEPVSLQIMNIHGKVIESRSGLKPSQTLQIGTGYRPGVYFAQVKQGARNVTIKMIKQ